MVRKEIKYIAYYDTQKNSEENRHYLPAAASKIDYICSVLKRIGINVMIVSASATKNKKIYSGKSYETEAGKLILFPTIGNYCKLVKPLQKILINISMLIYLLRTLQKGEVIIVYHSLGYDRLLLLLKLIKKIKIILEVEEIYADVSERNDYRKREMKLFKQADAFIFSTLLLNERINTKRKKHIVINGTYKVERQFLEKHVFSTNNKRIRVVYAGTFDTRKGGAAAAAEAAEFLDENYHIHIIGFGSEKDKQALLNIINVTRQKTKCGLSYDGLLSGDDYIRFIQSCDIGLSTQNPDAAFNATSFPSKVLSYMANGLRVVSVRIEAVEKSGVSDLISYYDEQTPEKIAEAIKNIDFSMVYDSRERIKELDIQFKEDLKKLLDEVHEIA